MGILKIYTDPNDVDKVIGHYIFEDEAGTVAKKSYDRVSLPPTKEAARAFIQTDLLLAEPEGVVYSQVDELDEQTDKLDPFIAAGEAEITYIDTVLAGWDLATNAQKIEAVRRLHQQNRQLIRAVLYLARQI